MLKVRVIPCLDVKNGRVVKGINFLDLKDAGDPVEQAKVYDEQGADELCFLDITASLEQREILFDIINKTAKSLGVKISNIGKICVSSQKSEIIDQKGKKITIKQKGFYHKF